MVNAKKLLAVLVVVAIFGGGFYYSNHVYLPEGITGTYKNSGDGFSWGWLAMDGREARFYYTDDYNKIYIKGTFTKLAEDRYALSCDDEANQAVIADQVITWQKNAFSLVMYGQTVPFEKMIVVPSLIEGVERYH